MIAFSKNSSAEVKQTESDIYEEQMATITTMQTVSLVEIGVICLFGIYQYYRLRGIIERKANS